MIPFPKPQPVTLKGYAVTCPEDKKMFQAESMGRLRQRFELHVTQGHKTRVDWNPAAPKHRKGAKAPGDHKPPRGRAFRPRHHEGNKAVTALVSGTNPHPGEVKTSPLSSLSLLRDGDME